MMSFFTELVLGPLSHLSSEVGRRIPMLMGGLLLLLIGYLIARGLRFVVERGLKFARLDEAADRVGFANALERCGAGRSPSGVIGFLAFWLVFLTFVVSAANALELAVVSELLKRFVLFIPRLVAAVVVAFAGVALGTLLGDMVEKSAAANQLPAGPALGKITRLFVVVFAGAMALEQVGIGTLLVSSSFQIVLGTVGLALGLAFGLGGRDIAAEILRDFLKRR